MSWDTSGAGADPWAAENNTNAHEYSNAAEFGGETGAYTGVDDGAGNDGAAGYSGGGSGGCFNCGEEGHMKVDCPNPAIAREVNGTCRSCEQPGHRASDCPNAPPKLCKNCGDEGHPIVECDKPRKIDRSDIADVPANESWAKIIAAVADRDLDDVKDAAKQYIKANPDISFPELEKAFRDQNIGVYLIALEKELNKTYTNMDLQGNLKKTYTVTWRFSPKPQRPKEAEGWPESPEQNSERLTDAGDVVDCLMPLCGNCEELGHTKKQCPQDANVPTDRAEVKCYNCDGTGHRVRDCPLERPDKFACRNCNKSGHSSKECPEPRSAEGVECKKCNEIGHFSRDCPTAPKIPCFNCGQTGHRKAECTNEKVEICRNCDGIGHLSRECPQPKDWSRVKCSNCQEMGHSKVKCKLHPVDENGGNDGNAGYGGDSGNAGYGGDSGNAGYDDAAAAASNVNNFEPSAVTAGGDDNNWGGGGGGRSAW